MTVRKIKRILTAFVFCLILSASTIPVCASAVSASNEETGYVYVLDDSADFLTDSQENSLQKQLYDLTAYCNVAFVTTTEHSKSSTEDFAADYFDDVFGPHDNGTIFVIDRCLNEIYLYSDGQAHKIITNSRARSITDNTYTYARDKDYYTCAYKVFAQIETLMQGKRIAEPMRYLCSALLAIVAALFLNLFFALWSSRSHKADRRQVMTGLYAQMQIHNPRTQFIRQSRTYSPVSSGSSGGNWVVFEPNDATLWARVQKTIADFLEHLWRNGMLAGASSSEAYFVEIGPSTMSQDDMMAGRLICNIGIAPSRPAEFIIFRITQHTAEGGE